jgi:hypothetical protein
MGLAQPARRQTLQPVLSHEAEAYTLFFSPLMAPRASPHLPFILVI